MCVFVWFFSNDAHITHSCCLPLAPLRIYLEVMVGMFILRHAHRHGLSNKAAPKFVPWKGRLGSIWIIEVTVMVLNLRQHNQAGDGSGVNSVLYLHFNSPHSVIRARKDLGLLSYWP